MLMTTESDLRILTEDEVELVAGSGICSADHPEYCEFYFEVVATRYTPPEGYIVIPAAGGSISILYNGSSSSITVEASAVAASLSTSATTQTLR